MIDADFDAYLCFPGGVAFVSCYLLECFSCTIYLVVVSLHVQKLNLRKMENNNMCGSIIFVCTHNMESL